MGEDGLVMMDGPMTETRVMVPKGSHAQPRALDLCCGAGGFAIALKAAGYRSLGFDSWQPAIDTHLANSLDAKLVDVMAEDWTGWRGKVEVIVGGPPCQPFSAAGDGKGEYDPRDCIPGFIRAVREVQPEWFVLENVRGLTYKRHADYLARVLEDLRGCGYRVDLRVLHAEEHGVPQTRQRLFIVGVRNSTKKIVRWPEPTHTRYRKGKPRQDEGLLPWVSMADALGWGFDHEPAATVSAGGTDTGGAEVFTNHQYRQRLSRWVYERPSTTIVGSFRPDIVAAPGYRKKGDMPRQNAPGSVKVSEEEAARLQAFPDGFTFTGNSGTVYKQIGNAVPPRLALAVIEANR